MKRKKKLLILLAVLAILVLAYVLMKVFVPSEDEHEEQTVMYEATDISEEDITGISFDRGEGECSFVRDGDTWVYSDNEALPIDAELVSTMAKTMSELVGTYRMLDVSEEDFAEYGLTEPSLKVKVTEGDDVKSYLFGMLNKSVDAYYFCNEKLPTLVFLVGGDAYNAFDYSMSDIIVKEDSPEIEADSVTGISLTDKDGNETVLSSVKTLIKEGDDENEPEYEFSATRTEGEETEDYSYADFYELAEQISNIKFDTLAGFTEEDASNLGFDTAATLTVTYTKRTDVDSDGAEGGYIETDETLTLVIAYDGENVCCKTSPESYLIYSLPELDLDF